MFFYAMPFSFFDYFLAGRLVVYGKWTHQGLAVRKCADIFDSEMN